jgi:hypothetical protein
LVLHEMTGWQIVGLRCRSGVTDHFMVRHPDGWLLDVNGTQTDHDALSAWEEFTGAAPGHYSVEEWEPEWLWDMPDMEDPRDQWEFACRVAEALIGGCT